MNTFETRHACGDLLPIHRHYQPYATLVLSGAYTETSADGLIECRPGTLLIHPSFHAHENRFRSRSRTLNIPLPPYSILGECRVVIAEPREAEAILSRCPQKWRNIASTTAAHEPTDLPDWCPAFVRELRVSDLPIARIAEKFGLSAAYASRKVRQVYGMPPILLRREWRWREAVSMLLDSGHAGSAAAAGGFADQSHFTRICKQITGQSPRRLYRQVKSVQDATGEMRL